MKNRNCVYSIISIALFLFLASGCENDDDSPINQTNGRTSAVFNPDLAYGTMTDQDGNEYKTFHINGQTWMAENLRTRKYRNGDDIPKIVSNTSWTDLTTGAYCNYNNTENIDTIATYGRLYNWYTISDSRNLAPDGWHVPTDAEWTTLINYLGGDIIAGGKLKEEGTIHWEFPNEGATNQSGLTVLAAGIRTIGIEHTFSDLGRFTGLWTNTHNDNNAKVYFLSYADSISIRSFSSKVAGYSVRLVKD